MCAQLMKAKPPVSDDSRTAMRAQCLICQRAMVVPQALLEELKGIICCSSCSEISVEFACEDCGGRVARPAEKLASLARYLQEKQPDGLFLFLCEECERGLMTASEPHNQQVDKCQRCWERNHLPNSLYCRICRAELKRERRRWRHGET